jgi:hypothetical protein
MYEESNTSQGAEGLAHTTDHEFIRSWVAERGGYPAMVRRVGQEGEGSLIINLPDDGSDDPIIDISWSDFFQRFEDQGLTFEYRPDVGPDDTFHRLVGRRESR